MPTQYQHDVLIIGSGAAGLSLALHLAPHIRVAVLSKSRIRSGSTLWAQGGIAAVMDEEQDSIESHVQDTLSAGAGLCHEEAVRFTVEQGRAAIQHLIDLGVPFSYEIDPEGERHLHLTREGGHEHRRVIHATDATGKALESTLESHVRAHENIELFESHMAIDLITRQKLGQQGSRALGAYVLNLESGQTHVFRSRFVVLATGGASKVYLYTTNPDLSTGDGIAMAWRAGCRVANMEFNQFHPTCLYHREARSFLISEAVRGEGGILRLPNGEAFMQRFDEHAELAPRDIVARAIDHEMKRLGIEHVYLDMTHKPESFIKEHFPTIYQRCLELGYNMAREPLPVVPAAHYTCGGIITNLQAQTDLPGLYAVGECAFTGLHGANRMASNSLLECLVFAKSASESILEQITQMEIPDSLPEWDESRVTDSDEEVVVSHNWEELRHFMWDYVGIVRTDKRLQRARRRAELLSLEIEEYYSNFHIHSDLLELRNLVVNASLIINCAIQRKESRGLHYTLDYPQADDRAHPHDTILQPDNFCAEDSPIL